MYVRAVLTLGGQLNGPAAHDVKAFTGIAFAHQNLAVPVLMDLDHRDEYFQFLVAEVAQKIDSPKLATKTLLMLRLEFVGGTHLMHEDRADWERNLDRVAAQPIPKATHDPIADPLLNQVIGNPKSDAILDRGIAILPRIDLRRRLDQHFRDPNQGLERHFFNPIGRFTVRESDKNL